MTSKQTIKGIEDGTGRLVDKNGKDRSPGDHPDTGQYDTAQMVRDEMYGGDTSQPLFD